MNLFSTMLANTSSQEQNVVIQDNVGPVPTDENLPDITAGL